MVEVEWRLLGGSGGGSGWCGGKPYSEPHSRGKTLKAIAVTVVTVTAIAIIDHGNDHSAERAGDGITVCWMPAAQGGKRSSGSLTWECWAATPRAAPFGPRNVTGQ